MLAVLCDGVLNSDPLDQFEVMPSVSAERERFHGLRTTRFLMGRSDRGG